MGLISTLLWGRGLGVAELATRLDIDRHQLKKFRPEYREFTIAKRSGGKRRIQAPGESLKKIQRRILRRLLARLRAHPAAHGFERGRSIVTNARQHQNQQVVMRLDLVDFFPSTRGRRVKRYFRKIGWNRPAATILTRLCTYEDGLPQGAPTSPRLSNLVNYRIDARLEGMTRALGGRYTRYADDITISFPDEEPWVLRSGKPVFANLERTSGKVRFIKGFVSRIVREEGYRLHRRKKLSVRRRHHRQMVTGLVVNQKVNLPRETRRRLRAAEHRARMAKKSPLERSLGEGYGQRRQPSLSPAQRAGWRALEAMIESQRSAPEE